MRTLVLVIFVALMTALSPISTAMAQQPSEELLKELGIMVAQMQEVGARYDRKLVQLSGAIGTVNAGRTGSLNLGELAPDDYQVAVACANCGGLSAELLDASGTVIEAKPMDFAATFFIFDVQDKGQRMVRITPKDCAALSCEYGAVLFRDTPAQ
ncbi:hypothetical protein [Hoeflea prorocentri]|uniref:Secreted protein n=1 Tax=Hoeflea prorocentri TaxID=1922333 RepID=A0A9X3UJM6_9HYPH|nr:hypothetical protein [Hoeflea prorocentri]MCY6380344.1 hypothetical protein [Hoeflea prorocentri]MDA5398144.1 hypothetical protein [Hoeflea prorocentri]